jgi:hypothetical protein
MVPGVPDPSSSADGVPRLVTAYNYAARDQAAAESMADAAVMLLWSGYSPAYDFSNEFLDPPRSPRPSSPTRSYNYFGSQLPSARADIHFSRHRRARCSA